MTAIENSRAEFEEFISSSPFEYSADRYPDSAAFPGTYKSLRVDLAWNAWCEARKEVVNLIEANAELHGDLLVAEKERDELRAKCAELESRLTDAATSLYTIATQAGRDEYMEEFYEVRAYARSRAICAGHVNQIEREGGE